MTSIDTRAGPASQGLGRELRAAGLTLATAESCTGGLIGALVTAAAGSSDYYLGGVVAYANAVKTALLGVDASVLAAEGAVSAAVARAMAEGVRRRLGADIGVATTGIAGPGGGSPDRPVGLVFIAVARASGTRVERHVFPGGRAAVRQAAAETALALARAAVTRRGDGA